jgi:hypothetical protein
MAKSTWQNRLHLHYKFWGPITLESGAIILFTSSAGIGLGFSTFYVTELITTAQQWDSFTGFMTAVTCGVVVGLLGTIGYFCTLYIPYHRHYFEDNVLDYVLVEYTHREIKGMIKKYVEVHRPDLNAPDQREARRDFIEDQVQKAQKQQMGEDEASTPRTAIKAHGAWRHEILVERDYTRYQHYQASLAAL